MDDSSTASCLRTVHTTALDNPCAQRTIRGIQRAHRDQSTEALKQPSRVEGACLVRYLRLSRFAALIAVLSSSVIHAQVTTATLYGVVRDSSGASVPGALVTV